MKSAFKSYITIAFAAALWGCIGLFFDMLTKSGFNSMQAATLRLTLAAIFFTLFLLIRDRNALKIKLRHIPYFIGTGMISLMLFNVCYFLTIEMSAVSVAAVLLYTSPVFVMIMSAIFFKETITHKKIIALIMTFAGCAFVTGAFGSGGENVPLLAVACGLTSGFAYALYSIIGKVALKKYSPNTVTGYTFIFASLGALPISGIADVSHLLLTQDVIIAGVGVAIFCTILPFVFYTVGLKGVEAGKAAIIATVEPVVASILGIAVLGEIFTVSKLIGIILVISAIVLLNAQKSAKTRL